MLLRLAPLSFRWIPVLVLLTLTGSGSLMLQTTPPTALATRILVITLDGARPDAILQSEAPHLLALAERGAFSWTAQTVFPPATLPAHGSLLSGLEPAVHRQADNVVQDCGDFPFPTWLSLAAAAGYRTGMVAGKAPLCQFITAADTTFTLAREGDRSVVDGVLALLDDDIQVILAHFPNPDYFGHLEGWMSEPYRYELTNTDQQIGRLLAGLDERDLTAATLILVTADHGGHDLVHGQDIPEDMTIPWLLAGPGVQPNLDLSADGLPNVRLIDIAPTVLRLLALPVPSDLPGRVVCEAFMPEVEARLCPSTGG